MFSTTAQLLHNMPATNGTAPVIAPVPPSGPATALQAGRNQSSGVRQTLTLVGLLTAYAAFLILGTFVHAEPLMYFREFFVLLTCWTWTNLLILCCLSSVIGELGRRALLGDEQAPQVQAALVRGFLLLLAVMAGQVVVVGTPAAVALPSEMIADAKKMQGGRF